MKYYRIETDKSDPLPDIRDIYTKIYPRYLTPELFHRLEDFYAADMKADPELSIPEIFTAPFLMVTREMYEVITAYEPELSVKYINFIENKRGIYLPYLIPLLHVAAVRTGKEEINAQTGVQKVILRQDRPKQAIFAIDDGICRKTVVRLDLLESILRRGMIRLKAQEIDLCVEE